MELMERIMEHAQSGYFCSQILMKLLLETVGEENPALVGAAGGLCGGVGFTSNTCGCMTAGACMISYFTGKREPDDFAHEQSLVIETKKGLIVFNSCSHTGVKNTLTDIQTMLGRSDIHAYVGGLHLFRMEDEALAVLCNEIRQTSIEKIFTGHCTGDHAYDFLRMELGDWVHLFSSGFTFRF